MEELDDKFPPRSIEINEYIYSYKDALTNDNFTNRCKNRTKCGIIIKIKKEELLKYTLDKKHIIIYDITSSIKTHKCKNINIKEDKNSENINEENKITNIKNFQILIKSLIVENLEKSLSFYIINLKNNNIILKKNQIKYLLQKYREEKYPSDSYFIKDIKKILITIDEKECKINKFKFL